MNNNRFVFIAPMYNASSTLPRMLHSLCGQSYDNWELILIDDVSSDFERQDEDHIIIHFNELTRGKINVIWNNEKKWEVANVLRGITKCEDDDIVCRLDADDALVDLDALAIINYAYETTGCEVAWSAHRWGLSDKNISGPMPNDVDPYVYPWVSSHLKTFRKRLINNVPDVNFRNEQGEYVRRAGDQAIYLPVLAKTQKRLFIPRVLYSYNIVDKPETYQTPDAKFQKSEADFIRHRGFINAGKRWEDFHQTKI